MSDELKNNLRAMGIIVLISIAFYILIFIAWNNSSVKDHAPSFYFWDAHKEGYEKDPLEDRYKQK